MVDKYILTKALQIRRSEELLLEEYRKGSIRGTIHTCIGQEIFPVLLADQTEDYFWFSNHRGHGHYIAKTNDFEGLFAEILGKENSVAHGVGGSQHLSNKNFLSNGIQGGQAAIAAGYSSNINKSKQYKSLMFIGDGTLGAGPIYEAWNMASLYNSKVIYVLEDNEIAQSTPAINTFSGDIKKRVEGFGLKYLETSDKSIEEMKIAIKEAVGSSSQGTPTLIHLHTKRLSSHSKSDDNRSPEYIKKLSEDDLLNVHLKKEDISYDQKEIKKVEKIFEKVSNSNDLVFSIDNSIQFTHELIENINPAEDQLFRDNINNALKGLLSENPENIIIGEDIVDDPYNSGLTYGGSFKVTKGLSTLFPGQVLSAPISESGLTGFGTGLSLRNNTTVIEIMFADFLSQNIDQIFHQVSKIPSIYGIEIPLNTIIRTAAFAGNGYGPTHSSSMDNFFLGLPNTIVCIPNLFVDYKLFIEIQKLTKKPMIILEPKKLYSKIMNPKIYDEYKIIKSENNYSNILITPKNFKPSVTVFTYGPQVDNVLSHLEDLALNHEIFLNVFIPSIVSPNSLDLLEESLHTTDGKLIIIEESINGFGVGAYWLSRINKELRIKKFHHLFPKDWIPSGKHEDEVLASKEKMIESIRGLDNE